MKSLTSKINEGRKEKSLEGQIVSIMSYMEALRKVLHGNEEALKWFNKIDSSIDNIREIYNIPA